MAKKHRAHFPKRSVAAQQDRSENGIASNTTGWVRRRLAVELLSDAHLGSGTGGGGIDALVARDKHDRPVIWASHLEGVLRDAARRLHGDDDAGGFFGRAGGQQQRALFTSLYAPVEPESHIWRSTARQAFDNRAPKEGTLRVVEYVPKKTEFEGEVELPAIDLPTLQRLVQEIDALGGGRSSGAGRVKLSLSPPSMESTRPAAGAPSSRLVLLLKNRDPLCITATATPDNFIPSLAFVPGRTLLGAVAAWLIAEGARETASLLTSGRVSVSDALPLPEAPSKLEDVEVLPAPLSLQSKKPTCAAGELPWWAKETTPTQRLDKWKDKEKLKRPEDNLFVYRASARGAWTPFQPGLRVRLRNGRPDPKQVDPSLFVIEQIVEETYFIAELRGSPEDLKKLAHTLMPVLEGKRWLRVGRAGAPVEVAQFEWAAAASAVKAPERVLLTLTSDLLVRDEDLRWRTALDAAALTELVGIREISSATTERGDLKALQDSVMVHGFNGTSRLWRMPAAAIRRGSVFEVSGTGVAKLAERIAKGEWLGERTHEGFGRFRIDVELPGANELARAATGPTLSADVDDEVIAARTQKWFEAHPSLAKSGNSGERKPSLSQWIDLVADLDREDKNAIAGRLNPTTAGGMSWKHTDAQSVLVKLSAVQEPKLYARLFVRWLRAEMRKRDQCPRS